MHDAAAAAASDYDNDHDDDDSRMKFIRPYQKGPDVKPCTHDRHFYKVDTRHTEQNILRHNAALRQCGVAADLRRWRLRQSWCDRYCTHFARARRTHFLLLYVVWEKTYNRETWYDIALVMAYSRCVSGCVGFIRFLITRLQCFAVLSVVVGGSEVQLRY